MSKRAPQLALSQDSDIRRLNHAVRHFQFMHQRLQALIATYDEYCKLANRSEPDMNDILKWVKDQVLHDIYSMRMYQKVDGMKVANAGRVCGESYLIEECVDIIRADQTDQKLTAPQAYSRPSTSHE